MFQELWASSDSGRAFAAALKARGYTLARGDRRGYVAVDYRGEVYAIARYAGQKTKDVRSRLGDEKVLPSVDEAKVDHASRMTEMLRRHIKTMEDRHRYEAEKLATRRKEIIERQREQRARLQKAQQTRLATETRERTQRLSRGFRGLWDRVTGKHAEIRKENEHELSLSLKQDQAARDALIFQHQKERQALHTRVRDARRAQAGKVAELHRDIAGFQRMRSSPSVMREQFRETSKLEELRSRRRERDRGPEREH